MRRGLTLALVVSGLFAAAPAQASTWDVLKLNDGPVSATLFGVSCRSQALCVAVGSNNTVASSSNPAAGASAWRIVHPGGALESPNGQSFVYPGDQIRGVSCPTTSLCVAAGPQGRMLVSNQPLSGDWDIFELGLDATHMYGISCASPSLCVAVAYNGTIVSSTDPTGGVGAWKITKLAQSFDLRGVACPSVSLCVAVGNEGTVLSSTDPTGGASAWRSVGRPGGQGSLNDVDCPSPVLCLSADAGQFLASTEPAGGHWRAFAAGTGLPVKGISCPSIAACAAVDNNADVIVSTNPLGGPAAWSSTHLIPAASADGGGPNGMFAISCVQRSLCVAVGRDRQLLVSRNPFSVSSATPQGATGKAKAKDKVKRVRRTRHRRKFRPDVRITAHPLQRTHPRGRRTRVGFRFRAIGRARRFKCRLDRRRWRTCRSPRRYRVGRGKHVFRVFAVGPTGKRGRRATFHFRVGRLTETPPVGTCKSGEEERPGLHPCVTPR